MPRTDSPHKRGHYGEQVKFNVQKTASAATDVTEAWGLLLIRYYCGKTMDPAPGIPIAVPSLLVIDCPDTDVDTIGRILGNMIQLAQFARFICPNLLLKAGPACA
jgi:hypothetical protein